MAATTCGPPALVPCGRSTTGSPSPTRTPARSGCASTLDDVTWVADDGIRYMNPEVVLYHKAMHYRPKDVRDRDVAWPLLGADQRAWLHDAVRRFYGDDHAWVPWMAERL